MPGDESYPGQQHPVPRKALSSSVLVQSFNAIQSPITRKSRSFHNKPNRLATPQLVLSNHVKMNRATSQNRIVSFFDNSHNFLPSWLGRSQQNAMGNCKIVPKSRSSNSINQQILTEEDIVAINNINAQFEALLDELNMKASQRIKLQQLSSSRKLFLIKQNEHIKNSSGKNTTNCWPKVDESSVSNCSDAPIAEEVVDRLSLRTPAEMQYLSPIRLSSSMSKMSTCGPNANQNRMSRVGSMAIEYDFMAWQQTFQLGSDRPQGYTNLLNTLPWQTPLDDNTSRARERDTPYYYVERLKNRHLSLDILLETLVSLRVLLSTMQICWIDEFITKENDGMSALGMVLKRMEERKKRRNAASRNSDKEYNIQHECVRCLRVLLNTEAGFYQIVHRPDILARLVVSSLYHPQPQSKWEIPKSRPWNSVSAFNSDHDLSTGATKLYTQTLEFLSALCRRAWEGYIAVMESMSSIADENYRFDHLIMTLCSPTCEDPDDLLPGTSTEWEYKDAAFGFVCAIVGTPDQIEERMMLQSEMKRRGLEEKIETLVRSSPPDSLREKIRTYLEERNADQKAFQRAVKMKRQSIWHMHPIEMVIQELKSFSVNPELEFIVIDCISNILNIGKQDHRKEADIWTIINMFTSAMTKAVDEDYHSAFKAFLQSVQPIIGKISTTGLTKTDEEVVTSKSELEELQSLRDMMSDTREQLLHCHETLAKIRREKKELLMKLSKAQGEVCEQEQAIAELEEKVKGSQSCTCPAQSKASISMSNNTSVPMTPPPPPPPPPPPVTPIAPSISSSRSVAHHQTSLVETSQSLLSSSGKKANRGSLQKRGSRSLTETPKDEACSMPRTTTKQFFWSKLTRERIHGTVWGEILILNRGTSIEGKQQSAPKGSDVMLLAAKINLDIAEIENFFGVAQKKDQGGEYTKAQMVRKPPLTTLLEFNRANNIAIMLARLKLSYPDIRDAIWSIDDEKLNIDNLKAIKQYIPTKEDIEVVKNYEGDPVLLGDAERYFRSIMFIPRLSDRMACMILRRRFRQEMKETLPDIRTIRQATAELKSASKFKKLLQIILLIGNYLNSSTMRGNAYGFRLEALLKMNDTKADSSNDAAVQTLLHYLVRVVIKAAPVLLDFMNELPHLHAAAKLSAASLHATINTLNAGLSHMEQEIRLNSQKKSPTQLDRFAVAMESFLVDAKPILSQATVMIKELDDDLQNLYIYYGEDPTLTKSEEFFGMLHTFATTFMRAHREVKEADERIVRSKQRQSTQHQPSYGGQGIVAQCNFEQVIKELSCHRLVRKHRQ